MRRRSRTRQSCSRAAYIFCFSPARHAKASYARQPIDSTSQMKAISSVIISVRQNESPLICVEAMNGSIGATRRLNKRSKRKKRVRWLARIHRSTRFGTKQTRGSKAGFDLLRTLVPGQAYRVYRMHRGVSTRSRDSYKLPPRSNS